MVISWRRATPKEPTPAHPGAPRLPLFGGVAADGRLHDSTHGAEEATEEEDGTKPQHRHEATALAPADGPIWLRILTGTAADTTTDI